MIDTSNSQIDLETGTPDEQFEKLRQRFRERLRKEQAQLATLNEALGSLDVASAPIFVDIRAFAHRLRGAAQVFGFHVLGDRSKAVELAVIAASVEENDQGRDPSVLSTMQELAISLADELDTGASCSPATGQQTAPASSASGNSRGSECI